MLVNVRVWGNEMSKFRKQAQRIIEVLSLKYGPIAGKFSNDADERGDSARELRVCEAFDVVRRENVVINLSKKNCTCAGGLHFIGLGSMPFEKLTEVLADKHRAFESVEIAMTSVKKQPRPVKRGNVLVLGPLEKSGTDPDFVILFVNPAQADRVLGLASFRGAEPFMYYPVCTICSTITNTLAKGGPEINFVSTFERRSGKWSSNELIITLPWKDFETAVESIPNSGFGTAQT
jgi:uncharacterized protein (DUF169 family)